MEDVTPELKWSLLIEIPPIQIGIKYHALLFVNRVEVADDYTMTKWGARFWAWRVKRRYYRRRKLTNQKLW
jgi:hypothetical protein